MTLIVFEEREGTKPKPVESHPIASMIASMITFHYRTRYLYRGRGRVSFNDFSSVEDYYYDKRNVIEEIDRRNHREEWYEPLLLDSEMWNLDEAIQDAKNYYVKMSPIILTYTHLDEEEIECCLEEMQGYIYDWEQRKKREIAKRAGKLEQYREELKMEWENECWQNYLYQRR